MDSFGFIESITIVSFFLSSKVSFFIEVISLICFLDTVSRSKKGTTIPLIGFIS